MQILVGMQDSSAVPSANPSKPSRRYATVYGCDVRQDVLEQALEDGEY